MMTVDTTLNKRSRRAAALAIAALGWVSSAPAGELLIREDFETGASRWEPSDPAAWKISAARGGQVYELITKKSDYKPPHRSPLGISILKDVVAGDFVLTAKVKTTHESYGHRDMCLIFGYQDPAHFYYVHFGQATDDHANQIFIVNGAPRTKISTRTTRGTPWEDDTWHRVKIVRSVKEGTIEVFFNDLEHPVMVASDKSFAWGKIGIGSFDDTGMWDDIVLNGERVEPSNESQ
ncbi:MAG: hypothetical protein KDN22_13365 [Verrucomicrobiae bacterium]|nr:hypothetical protein [Verrucomicrobiae bacterium]